MKAIVAGASGLVGSELVDQLINDNYFDRIQLLVRRRIERFETKKVIQALSDFSKLAELNLNSNFDVGFCALGTTIAKAGSKEEFHKVDFDFVLNFAKLCQGLNVQKFILISALGADSESKIYYNQVKGQIENELKKMNFRSLIFLRPSLLLGERQEERFAEGLAQRFAPLYSPFLRGPLRRYKPVEAKKVAIRMREAAKGDDVGLQIFESEKID